MPSLTGKVKYALERGIHNRKTIADARINLTRNWIGVFIVDDPVEPVYQNEDIGYKIDVGRM